MRTFKHRSTYCREVSLSDKRRILLPRRVHINDWPRSSQELRKVMEDTGSHLLVCGDTGTGKETIADYVFDYSKKSSSKKQRINCAAFDQNLVGSELFGHIEGAYTGAIKNKTGLLAKCDGGILFLDEIGWMEKSIQARLLRFMEDGVIRLIGKEEPEKKKSNVRIIAATNQDLNDCLLPDFRARFDFEIRLPPLCDRIEDIPWFLAQPDFFGGDRRFARIRLSALLDILLHDWPKNVRGLKQFCRRCLFFGDGIKEDNSVGFSMSTIKRKEHFAESCYYILVQRLQKLSDQWCAGRYKFDHPAYRNQARFWYYLYICFGPSSSIHRPNQYINLRRLADACILYDDEFDVEPNRTLGKLFSELIHETRRRRDDVDFRGKPLKKHEQQDEDPSNTAKPSSMISPKLLKKISFFNWPLWESLFEYEEETPFKKNVCPLNQTQRLVLELACDGKMTRQEIADKLNLKLSKVKTIIGQLHQDPEFSRHINLRVGRPKNSTEKAC